MNDPATNGVVSAADVARLMREHSVDVATLMTMLLPSAAAFARPPISDFHVGVVAKGGSGALYYGANLEFTGEALPFTVHAEQSAVINAWSHGERAIEAIAVNAAPCGFCRQFLNELAGGGLTVAIGGTTRTLGELLPHSFGPRDLGVPAGLMQEENHRLTAAATDELSRAALEAANRSYAPYSQNYAGVALRTRTGAIFTGAYAENAAFNPSLSPMQAALSQLNLGGGRWEDVVEVVLVQSGTMHATATRAVLAAIGDATLRVVEARNSA